MCLFEDSVPMYFAGDDSEPCAYVEVGVFARSEAPAYSVGANCAS